MARVAPIVVPCEPLEKLLGLRFGVALSMMALGVTFVCAAIVVVAHWTPGALMTPGAYNWAFSVHGAPILVLLPALVLLLSELGQPPPVWRPPWLLTAAWLAFGVQCLAIIASLIDPGTQGPIWREWVGLALLPPCALVGACVLPRLRGPVRARDLALAFASVVQIVGLGLVLPLDIAKLLDPLAHPALFSLGHLFTGWLLEVTALAAVAAALGENGGRRGPLIPVAVLAVTTIVPGDSLLHLPASLAAIVSAGWLLAFSLKRRQVPRSAGESMFAALAAVTFLEAASFGQFLRVTGVDIHLHDTYFVVGLFHLRATTCLVAVLAVACRHTPKSGQAWLVSIAALLSIVGSQVMSFAMLVVGSRGMPRRYFNYLPEFQPFHRAIGIGGGLLMLGVVVALFGILKSRSTPRSPTDHNS